MVMPHVTAEVGALPGQNIGIAILAKAPVPGLAKTRLIPHLGAQGAANLQGWLLRKTVMTALDANLGPITLWCAPDAQHPDFKACLAYGSITLRDQPEADLGIRMWTAIAESPSSGCLVVGTDCAVLTAEFLRKAAAALEHNRAVLAPAEDGGYVLIGLRETSSMSLFSQINWSTNQVMLQTRQRLDAHYVPWAQLETLWDIDRPEDFERLLRLYPELADPATGILA